MKIGFFAVSLLPILSVVLAMSRNDVLFNLRFLLIFVISLVAMFAVFWVIPKCMPSHIRKNMCGKDLNKLDGKVIPESLGLESCFAFLMAVIAIAAVWGLNEKIYPAIVCVLVTTLLGFADDVLDIPWRVKFVIPFITSLPLILNYDGSTTICLHGFLAPFRKILMFDCLNIGFLYYIYIICLMVFCTHCVNIYAGINGLEAGQSLVVSSFLLFHSLCYWSETRESQAAMLLLPFTMTTVALLYFNWFPSRVFVGDTFTLTAGAVIAAAGILDHFAEMTLLFMTPQVINFLMSLPQLVGFVKCERHRLPVLDKKTGKLHGQRKHWNLVNWWLILFGPKTEERLCIELLLFQVFCCVMSYVVKYFYNQALIP